MVGVTQNSFPLFFVFKTFYDVIITDDLIADSITCLSCNELVSCQIGECNSYSLKVILGGINPCTLALRPQMPVWTVLKVVGNYRTEVLGSVLLLSILLS